MGTLKKKPSFFFMRNTTSIVILTLITFSIAFKPAINSSDASKENPTTSSLRQDSGLDAKSISKPRNLYLMSDLKHLEHSINKLSNKVRSLKKVSKNNSGEGRSLQKASKKKR